MVQAFVFLLGQDRLVKHLLEVKVESRSQRAFCLNRGVNFSIAGVVRKDSS